ncbi:MAG: hypothetical protein C0497_03195 [Gemmatimonas sp.]|nr:hypothetical protein [Gemmatimonas sp.]
MRLLIADPTYANRLMFTRVLGKLVSHVVYAVNGLDALRLIASEDIDLMITELDLPVLDGLGLIEAVRDMPAKASLPIMCVAATTHRGDLARLSGLGVSDFLLKPARPKDLFDRVNWLRTRHASTRSRTNLEIRSRLLLADSDPHFLAFAGQILERTFDVITATNGMEAAIAYADVEPKPRTVICSDNLSMIKASGMTRVIRSLAAAAHVPPPEILLLASEAPEPTVAVRDFDAVLRRSFVPALFTAQINRHVLKTLTTFERLERSLHTEVPSWLSSAMEESLGVMLGHEAKEVRRSEVIRGKNPVVARLRLAITDVDVPLFIEVYCDAAVSSQLASRILGEPTDFENGGDDVLGELTNTVAGRIMLNLSASGFKASNALPSTVRAQWPDDTDHGVAERFFHAPDVGDFCVRLAFGDRDPVPERLWTVSALGAAPERVTSLIVESGSADLALRQLAL